MAIIQRAMRHRRKRAPMQWWSVPNDWAGEPAFVVGGGSSLAGFDFGRLRGCGRIIAVNAALLDLPFADILFFNDARFLKGEAGRGGFADALAGFDGLKVTTYRFATPRGLSVCHLRCCPGPLSGDPGALAGRSSGARAMNLAYLLGADPVYLLGFDMRPNGNFHDHYAWGVRQGHYDAFLPDFEAMSAALLATGRRAFNCSLDSAATVLPKVSIEDVLPPLGAFPVRAMPAATETRLGTCPQEGPL